MNKKQVFLLMFFVIIAMLAYFFLEYHHLYSAREIELEVTSIALNDPSGANTITLHFEISRIDLGSMPYDGMFLVGDSLFAILTKKDGIWTIDSVNHSAPFLKKGQACMRGKTTSAFGNRLLVHWGIENYSIPEGDKEMKAKLVGAQKISAIVVVNPDCSFVLKRLVCNEGEKMGSALIIVHHE